MQGVTRITEACLPYYTHAFPPSLTIATLSLNPGATELQYMSQRITLTDTMNPMTSTAKRWINAYWELKTLIAAIKNTFERKRVKDL